MQQMSGQAVPEGNPPSQVVAQMTHLKGNIDRVEQRAARLAARLMSVLADRGAVVAGNDLSDEAALCPLADELRDGNSRLDVCVRTLDGLLDSLES